MPSHIGDVLSVNVAAHASPTGHKEGGRTGIGKVSTAGPVRVQAPGPKGVGGSGLLGDTIADLRNHGGDDQAVYAYAREDLDWWQGELGRPLAPGLFGENLTTRGIEVTGALVGERWRVGAQTVLEVACARIPCAVFAEKMGEHGWIKRFTARAVPGAYLRVLTPGAVRGGDRIEILERPRHGVTVGMYFRALTGEAHLLPRLLDAGDALPAQTRDLVARRMSR